MPNLTESVSQSQDGKLHLTLTNLSLDEAEDIESIFADSQVKAVKGTVLTGKMQAHNTFDEPDQVHEEAFSAVTVKEDRISFTIPACSVLHLEVELA